MVGVFNPMPPLLPKEKPPPRVAGLFFCAAA
jgi:hypothetical protein